MVFCTKCGTQLADNARFCSACAAPTGTAGTFAAPDHGKCPSCGASIPSMSAVCSFCGHEFKNIQANSTVKDFFNKYDAISQDIYEQETAKEAKGPLGGAFGAMMGLDDFMKTNRGISPGIKRKIAFIESYPIPNAKEDILEFILLASTRYKGVKKPLSLAFRGAAEKMEAYSLDQAWKAKCEQAYMKAKISFGTDKPAITEIETILKKRFFSKCI